MAVVLLPQRTPSPLAARGSGEGCRRAALHLKTVVHPGFQTGRQHGSPRPCLVLRAARNGQTGPSSSNDFNLAEYVEAKVESGELHCLMPGPAQHPCQLNLPSELPIDLPLTTSACRIRVMQ